MIEFPITLTSGGSVCMPGYVFALALGYTKNRGVYRLAVTASGEWEGLTIRCFWHVPDGKDPSSSLVVDGYVAVPASVTAQPGSGCITFEGSDDTKNITSADLHYRVSANSGTEDGTEPEPGTPAWQQLVDAVHTDATAAEQAKTDAQTAASEADTSAGNADQSAQAAADSLQELKDSIANGNFKGEPGNDGKSPVVTVTDIENGHRVSITDKDGTKTIDVLNGKDGKDAPQIDDATVTDSAPWSSKHIVDMLCPPLDETGNPVQFYPVAGYPLGVKASWEPTQEGTGGPSPDNVRSIKGKGSVTVERCGGNLLNPKENANDTYTPYGLTITYIGDNKVHLSGTYQENGGSFVILDTRQQLLAGKGLKITGFTMAGTKQSYTLYGLRTKNETVIAMSAQFAKGDVIDMTVAVVVSGTTAPNTYAPYTGQTTTLTLPRTIYGGTVDAVTGEGNENAKIITLDGNELKFTKANIYINLPVHSAPGILKSGIICCSHFNRQLFAVNTTYEFCFLLESDMTSLFASVDDLNAYLAAQYAAGTPVQIAYKLAEPMPFTAPGAQPISALSGVNTLLTDADSVTVTGRADPIKRIIDLEDAVASMTTT